AWCALYSLGESIYSNEFSSLLGYWEPLNPDSWINNLTHSSNLDPGAGYWVFSPSEGLYAPSTVC
ncbi:hypothetical protein GOV05_04305, partial [Candidatus Woesearchaeota archaeon]|nr:hypothetical protein [Candidatus Woesearchaeota archaeon]